MSNCSYLSQIRCWKWFLNTFYCLFKVSKHTNKIKQIWLNNFVHIQNSLLQNMTDMTDVRSFITNSDVSYFLTSSVLLPDTVKCTVSCLFFSKNRFFPPSSKSFIMSFMRCECDRAILRFQLSISIQARRQTNEIIIPRTAISGSSWNGLCQSLIYVPIRR